LQLAKRSAPVEAAPSTNSSIFGGAKPVDTAAKEREIEEKLDKQKPEKPQNRSRTTSERSDDSIEKPAQKSGNSIFGGARPVDTTKREREIEEKLRKTDINNEKPKTSNHPQHKNESNNQRSRDRPETEEKEKKVRSPPPPKEVEEAKPPNFAVSNKYAFLNDDDDVGSGKEDSD